MGFFRKKEIFEDAKLLLVVTLQTTLMDVIICNFSIFLKSLFFPEITWSLFLSDVILKHDFSSRGVLNLSGLNTPHVTLNYDTASSFHSTLVLLNTYTVYHTGKLFCWPNGQNKYGPWHVIIKEIGSMKVKLIKGEFTGHIELLLIHICQELYFSNFTGPWKTPLKSTATNNPHMSYNLTL
jgi:hypothetical protein